MDFSKIIDCVTMSNNLLKHKQALALPKYVQINEKLMWVSVFFFAGSDEELRDLKIAYELGKGDMDIIYECVPFVSLNEESRIRTRIQQLIDSLELTPYNLFTNEPKAKRTRRINKVS